MLFGGVVQGAAWLVRGFGRVELPASPVLYHGNSTTAINKAGIIVQLTERKDVDSG